MMVLTSEERKERRQKALERTKADMTKVEKIRQAFVAGRRPMVDVRTKTEAVMAASLLLRELQKAMTRYELDPNDCEVHVAFVDTNFTGAFTRPLVLGQEPQLIADLQSQDAIMLGSLFALVDRDPEGKTRRVVGVKSLLETERGSRWMDDLAVAMEIGKAE